MSCNVAANTVFYNSLGYETVAMFVVGEDNVTWKGAPVVIAIVSVPASRTSATLTEAANLPSR